MQLAVTVRALQDGLPRGTRALGVGELEDLGLEVHEVVPRPRRRVDEPLDGDIEPRGTRAARCRLEVVAGLLLELGLRTTILADLGARASR